MATYGMAHPRAGRLRRGEVLLIAAVVLGSVAIGFETGRVTAPSQTAVGPAPAVAFVPRAPDWRHELNRATNVQLLAQFEVRTPAWHRHLNEATNVLLAHEAAG